jgi:hypothetical protein
MTPAQRREKEDAARLFADACDRLEKMKADPKCPAGKLKGQERVVSVLRRQVG